MIAEALSKKYYFIQYSYREDMVSDAVYTCLKYIDKFNPEKTRNPFSYFTQISFYAFVRKIQTEKKQTYTKSQIIKNLGVLFDDMMVEAQDLDQDYHSSMSEILMMQGDDKLDKMFGKKPKEKKEVDETVVSEIFDIDPDTLVSVPDENTLLDDDISGGV